MILIRRSLGIMVVATTAANACGVPQKDASEGPRDREAEVIDASAPLATSEAETRARVRDIESRFGATLRANVPFEAIAASRDRLRALVPSARKAASVTLPARAQGAVTL